MNTRQQLIASGVLKSDVMELPPRITVPVNQTSVRKTMSRINAIIARRTLVNTQSPALARRMLVKQGGR